MLICGAVFTDQPSIDDNYGKTFYLWLEGNIDSTSDFMQLKAANKVKYVYAIEE